MKRIRKRLVLQINVKICCKGALCRVKHRGSHCLCMPVKTLDGQSHNKTYILLWTTMSMKDNQASWEMPCFSKSIKICMIVLCCYCLRPFFVSAMSPQLREQLLTYKPRRRACLPTVCALPSTLCYASLSYSKLRDPSLAPSFSFGVLPWCAGTKQGPTMMSYLSFGPAEWGSLIQLFFAIAGTLLGVLSAIYNMTFFGVPLGVINKVGCATSWLKDMSTMYMLAPRSLVLPPFTELLMSAGNTSVCCI